MSDTIAHLALVNVGTVLVVFKEEEWKEKL